jgi:hypothetical protein
MDSEDEVNCRQLVDLVTDYFEHVLAEPTLVLVEEHLVMCDWCSTYVEQLRTTLAGLKDLPAEPPPSALRVAVRDALRTAASEGRGGMP